MACFPFAPLFSFPFLALFPLLQEQVSLITLPISWVPPSPPLGESCPSFGWSLGRSRSPRNWAPCAVPFCPLPPRPCNPTWSGGRTRSNRVATFCCLMYAVVCPLCEGDNCSFLLFLVFFCCFHRCCFIQVPFCFF